ncbi:DUF4331 family protein [Flavobacterium sp. NG2]|uniref:DUF4331 family protein n=1 Tax=Flavobacterium sp. NG2 TaxID=3097547 RepID=UPI002A83D781|nr:DUF4331 family protein [Flavobacterium sp. NG2]WPR71501.1 DUF4331 family protein [Flavobacterium sp. NG2]
MKTNKFTIITLALICALGTVSCNNDDNDNAPSAVDFSGTYVQQDQMGRPAINTVFVASGQPKDDFNNTTPSAMGAIYTPVIKAKLQAFGYTSNALGHSIDTFASVLATDVLNVSTSAKTTFFDGTNVLTGRALADDVIDVELLLIFGGPTGGSNPGLTKDNVNKNDKDFLTSFPYLAAAW